MDIKEKYTQFKNIIIKLLKTSNVSYLAVYEKEDEHNNSNFTFVKDLNQSKFADPNFIRVLFNEVFLDEGEVDEKLKIGRLIGGEAETYYDFDTKQIMHLTRLRNPNSKEMVGAVIEIKDPYIDVNDEYIQMYYMNGRFVNPEEIVEALGANNRLIKR